MADAYRSKASVSGSTKTAYGAKGKTSRLAAPKNQQPPGAAQASVLPRIDRRGELPQKPAKNGGLSIQLPPRRQSSKDAIAGEDNSPTFHGDELEGPNAKAAWCTPRNPAPELPTGSQVALFFAAPEANNSSEGSSTTMPTPLRLQSVQATINADEERYRVDMEQLASNNSKFFEISMSANQHLEHMHNLLPNISEVFDQTASDLQNLSSDIATLHQQHEDAKNNMANRFEAAMGNNAEEMVSLSEAHASEKAELIDTHERELRKADDDFREKVAALEEENNEMEKKYLHELQELRQQSEDQIQALEHSNLAEKEERERSAKAALEALEAKAQEELGDLRSRTQAAYTELQERSQTEFAELQQTSASELVAVKQSLTAEIVVLKQTSAANLAALADRSMQELQEHREQSNEALQRLKFFYAKEHERLLEKASEEVARWRMFEIEQSARMEARRCQETETLRDELAVTSTEYAAQIQELHRWYSSELEVLKAASESEKTLLLQTHASETERIKAAAGLELAQTIATYEDRLHSMTEAHAVQAAQKEKDANKAREALIAKYESDLESLRSERMREKDSLVLHYETELEASKQASREEHDKSVKLHEAQVAQLRDAHASRALALEMTMREQNKQAEDAICEKDAELESRQTRIDALEAGGIALREQHELHVERSQELVEQKTMALCELESEVWRLDQMNAEKDLQLDSTTRALKAAEEDLQVKANTILELTFVIKSRDDEIEKLRNALLDTVQTVNTKTEILELTTETLTSKAKELEATKNALRLESGKLSMVEESMSQKVGLLENTELKMESMRLNMENMRLEMKRMQMDMKLQLEHTEGEIELKNGEIRRLHGAQSELKQKNEFGQQTIERLEESLAFAQRQGEEAHRRIELLRLEATQAAEETKKLCDDLFGKEQELVVVTREKQTAMSEKQRLQIQFNNLTNLAQMLREKVELHTMQAEEIQCQYQKLLEEIAAEKDERLRSEKHLHMLELSAAKDMVRHLEGVEGRLRDANSTLEGVTSEKQHLESKIQGLRETLKQYEDTDRQLHAANDEIGLKNKLIEDKVQEIADLHKHVNASEIEAKHQLDVSRMEIEDSWSNTYQLMCVKDEMLRQNSTLETSLGNLRGEKEQLILSLGQEKREIVSRAENLQETIAGLRKEGARAAGEITDLQHALSEKRKELAYLQENLGDQTTDTRKIKTMLESLRDAHTELQAQYSSLTDQREKENKENLDTIRSLQQDLESKTKECDALQQSLDIQRQELDLLMVQHDAQVMLLTDGHRSEAVQLIESHRAQLAQMTEDHLSQVARLTGDNLASVTKLKERHLEQVNWMTEEHQSEIARLTDEISRLTEQHQSETTQLQQSHQIAIDRLTEDLRYQVSELTVDRLSLITEQTEEHHAEVSRLKGDHAEEVASLTSAHQTQLTQLTEGHDDEVSRLKEANRSEIVRLQEEHDKEVARMAEEHCGEITSLEQIHQNAVSRLTDVHSYQVSELTVDRLSEITEQNEEHNSDIARLSEDHARELACLTEEHSHEIARMVEEHSREVEMSKKSHQEQVDRLQDDQCHQISEMTVDRLSHTTEQNETHASEIVRRNEEHAAEIARLGEGHAHELELLKKRHQDEVGRLADDHRGQISEMTVDKLSHFTEQNETHASEIAHLKESHARDIARLAQEHAREMELLKKNYQGEVDRLTDDIRSQVSSLTLDRISCIEQTEEHKSEVARLSGVHAQEIDLLKKTHEDEVGRLADDHCSQVSELTMERISHITEQSEGHRNEIVHLTEELRSEITHLTEEHRSEVDRLIEDHRNEIAQLKTCYQEEINRLTDDHSYEVSELTVDRLSHITEQTEEHRHEVARLEGDRDCEMARLVEDHRAEIARLEQTHTSESSRLRDVNSSEAARVALEHLSQITELADSHRMGIARLEEDRDAELARVNEDHRSEVDQLIGAHQNYVDQLRAEHYDGFGLLQEEYEGKLKEIDENFAGESNKERSATRHAETENAQLRDQQRVKTRAISQQQMLLKQAASEQIRVVCAHSLELMTIHVTHQHEVESMKKHAAQSEQSFGEQLATLQSRNAQTEAELAQTLTSMKQTEVKHTKALMDMEVEHSQVLREKESEHDQALTDRESEHAQALVDIKQQHSSETEAARQVAEERYEGAIVEHKKTVDELTETFTQNIELTRLRLTEEHLTKVNELLERSRAEEERHAAALGVVREELSDKLNALKSVEDVVGSLKIEIDELQTQLQDTKQEVLDRDAVVAAKNATIDNVRKELNILLETSKSTRSSEQFVALLRQQLETHMMEVYHVELNELSRFVLEEESDLLGCLKGFFAMRCYRGVAPQGPDGRPESSKAVASVDDVRERLQEYDRVAAALDRVEFSSDDSDPGISSSKKVASLLNELGRLKLHVSKIFVSSDNTTTEMETTSTGVWVQLLENLAGFFNTLAIPTDLEKAFVRSRQVLDILEEHEKLMLDAKSSCVKDDIQSMADIGGLFTGIEQVLARAQQVTGIDKFVRLGDLKVLFDEWEELHKVLDETNGSGDTARGCSLDADTQSLLTTGNYLRSAEILASREEAAAFVRRCKSALLLPYDDASSLEEIIEAIEQLMKVVQYFELLQPKLGSPRRQSAATDPPPTLENKVTAVLAFVEELQLMADFAQNILSAESRSEAEPTSNESSRSSLEALRALTRTPSPAPTLEELQIDVELAVDDAIEDFGGNVCEFSNDEGERQREAFFSSPEAKSSSRSPSPFLADSLMDISLVMSDHHRLLSQTAHWVAKSRQGGPRSHAFSVGTEISRLVREHCALLSLSRRLFKMKDPRQELVSLLEGVALLERMTARLALFQARSARDTDEMSCRSFPDSFDGVSNPSESATSLGKSDIDSIESLSRPVLASIGDMARHLQDYDYFLQQVKVDDGRMERGGNSPAAINIEALVQEINERVMLVEQSKELLGLENPIEELPPFLIGAQEVLRQAKQIRESSSVSINKNSLIPDLMFQDDEDPRDEAKRAGNGVEDVLSEMDAVVEDLHSYSDMLEWLKQVLPQPEAVISVSDLKDRVKGVLTQVETLTRANTSLTEDTASLRVELEVMEQNRDHLLEEAAKEGALLFELATLQAKASQTSVHEASPRLQLLQGLIEQQQRVCEVITQQEADVEAEKLFLRQRGLLSEQKEDDDDGNYALSVSTRIGIYNRLLECADMLRREKSEMESKLNAEKVAMESSLREEKDAVEVSLITEKTTLESSLTAEKNTLEATLKAEKSAIEASLKAEKSAMELALNDEIRRKTEKLETVEGELAETRRQMENALAQERAFLESKEIFSSVVDVGRNAEFSRIQVYTQLHDEMTKLLSEKQAFESCATREYKFLQENDLLSSNSTSATTSSSVPATLELSSIRLDVFQRLVDSQTRLRQHDDDLAQENCFLHDNNLAFDLDKPQKSRLAVYETLLAGQNALIEEKMEREVAAESEKAFLASHGVTFENTMEIYEQFVVARKQLADLTTELKEELKFLAENHLYSSDEADDKAASLTTPFSSSFRLLVYRKLMQTEDQAREASELLKENMEQQLSRQIAADEFVIATLTAKVERLEASLMAWQESTYASQREWDRMLLEEEDKRRALIRHHEDAQKQIAEAHARALEEITKVLDSAVALASATHAEALEQATQEHERRLAAELHKQVQQFELAVFMHGESESHKKASGAGVSDASPSISAAQTRAQLLETFAKRDTTAIGMIYKAIRLTTDILSAAPTAASRTVSAEVSTDVTQTVLACVKELKTLKEFLVQSLEQAAKDDDQVPPPFAKAPFAKWMTDAVTRATADKECAIDLALCSHREFMSFAEIQLLARQEETEKALARAYDKLKAAAISGGFTVDQEKLLALELEVTREREARETVACKFRLNEEYYRRLLDERKEMEIAQAATVQELRDECTALRLKLEKLEQQIQQQSVLPQFRPPSSNTYTSSPRASVMSPQTPRVLKSAVVSNIPMPMRPERPRGGGSAHKERFVSDLERDTGQRRTSTTARRYNEWKAREEAITENPGSQLEQDFRAMQAAITSHHAPAMEPVVPTAMAAPATAPGSSLQNQELWYQGVRSIHYASFFISIFHVPRQQLFRVEVFNSDTEQQQQTVYVTWTEMQAFLQESRKAVRLGIALPADPELAVTVPHHVRAEIMDVLFERVRVYGEGTENILLGFE
ncbi:hypothetical protein PF010_g4200 [Phytophthora fragariae]|uniref:Uncharacterized protein n=1 Tax=Phytophthora fragariae TaxID=53985 RepID=A0A6G0LTG9_9STRA|nr:hypothetical protein PF010_g4200 [Phytophthora fragariae]